MTGRSTYRYLFAVWVGLGVGLLAASGQAPAPSVKGTAAKQAAAGRVVYLAGGLGDEDLIVFTANLAAGGNPGVVVLDSPEASPYTKAFLAAFQPEQVIPVGAFPQGIADLERRLSIKTAPGIPWKRGPPDEWWQRLFPQAERVVVCPGQPRRLLLQAACLAGAARAPLVVVHGDAEGPARIRQRLEKWKPGEVLLVGDPAKLRLELPDARIVPLADEEAVAAAYLRHQVKDGPVRTLVVANPADDQKGRGGMSALAPWIALQRRAALLLTNDAGDNASTAVQAALKNPDLRGADALILAAGLQAIPMERRPNSAPGKDKFIEMEPFTPRENEPFTFATGRLFHKDRGVVALMLARQRLLASPSGPPRALVVSNPSGDLPLMETISRNTAREFQNTGYQTTALFGEQVTKDQVRRLLPKQSIFLWEGHHQTLVERYGLPTWPEPLQPSLIFLQSCLALNENEAQPLLQRGAVAVVGASSRTYSGTGGALTLAYFDAMLYDDQTLGGSLRQAKNFLLTYAMLKDKRLGEDAKLSGANRRSAWAFTLWGDPTAKLPRPEAPANALPPVRHQVRGNTITITLPEKSYPKVASRPYEAEMFPNARLAGLIRRNEDDDSKDLVPLVFAEVHLPKAPSGQTPHLSGRLPARRWAFAWDARRGVGYLLAMPREEDRELRFRIEWQE